MFLANIINMYFCVRQALSLKAKMFYRMWSYVDFFIIFINSYVVIYTLVNPEYSSDNTRHMRVFESFQMLLLWFKSLYYLALIG